MSVLALHNRVVGQWQDAEAELGAAIDLLRHPKLIEHRATAERLLRGHAPSRAWADRIAAIAVIAERRADSSPTMAGRVTYLAAAGAAYRLLELAREVHGVLPCAAAVAALPGIYSSTDMASSSSGVRSSSTSS